MKYIAIIALSAAFAFPAWAAVPSPSITQFYGQYSLQSGGEFCPTSWLFGADLGAPESSWTVIVDWPRRERDAYPFRLGKTKKHDETMNSYSTQNVYVRGRSLIADVWTGEHCLMPYLFCTYNTKSRSSWTVSAQPGQMTYQDNQAGVCKYSQD